MEIVFHTLLKAPGQLDLPEVSDELIGVNVSLCMLTAYHLAITILQPAKYTPDLPINSIEKCPFGCGGWQYSGHYYIMTSTTKASLAQPPSEDCRLFHSPFAQPWQQAIVRGCAEWLWVGSEKQWELPPVTWVHIALQFTRNKLNLQLSSIYIFISQSHKQ